MTKSDEFFPIVIWQSFIESILVVKRINTTDYEKVNKRFLNITWVKNVSYKIRFDHFWLRKCLLTSYVCIY